jgi:hypothetical protein
MNIEYDNDMTLFMSVEKLSSYIAPDQRIANDTERTCHSPSASGIVIKRCYRIRLKK